MNNPLYVICLLTLCACSEKEKSSRATIADSVETIAATRATQTVETLPGKPIPKNGASVQGGTWRYEKTLDKADQAVYKALITSPTLLEFGFPYAGGSTATLTIRKRDSGTTVYLQVSKGQFNRSFQGGTARIRFDGSPPITYSFSAAENGSANIIFFDPAEKLIDRLKKSQKIIIDVEFYAQGKRQIEFRTADLIWRH